MNAPIPGIRVARWRSAPKPLAACVAAILATGGVALLNSPLAAAAPVAAQVGPPRSGAWAQHFVLQRRSRARAALQMAPPGRPAGVRAVTSCADDGGSGTLRRVVENAISGDTVDLGALACSTITLTQGAIVINPDDLTLQGPAAGGVTIDGNGVDSVLVHYGSGTLDIEHLTIANGYYDLVGGCIYSAGSVLASGTTITGCSAYQAAGILVEGALTLRSSTLSDNSSAYGGGGIVLGATTMENSTISGNHAASVGGGMIALGDVDVHNSTIAANTAVDGGAGIFFPEAHAFALQSSIVATNTGDTDYAADLGSPYATTISGTNNLVLGSDLGLPADTLSEDPRLAPLADNGGPTPTHALSKESPALDAGNNSASLAYDQRGPGFARVSGPSADIGAFELQGDDTIFKNGFDP